MKIEFNLIIFLFLITLYILILIVYKKFKNERYESKDIINIAIYLAILFIISKTIFPIIIGIYKYKGFKIYNIIPFKVIIDMYKTNTIEYMIYQCLGNIVLFIPLGYIVSLKTKLNIQKSIVYCFLITFSIEVIQGFIPYRYCEIDDIILNTMGSIIGMIINVFTYKRYKRL